MYLFLLFEGGCVFVFLSFSLSVFLSFFYFLFFSFLSLSVCLSVCLSVFFSLFVVWFYLSWLFNLLGCWNLFGDIIYICYQFSQHIVLIVVVGAGACGPVLVQFAIQCKLYCNCWRCSKCVGVGL